MAKTRIIQFVSCNWFVLTEISLPNGDEPDFILPSFARPLYFFFLTSFLPLAEINIARWKQSMILHFRLQLFHFKSFPVWMPIYRWENLDRGQYPLQPIKFVDLVVPSPCETEPCNKYVTSNFSPLLSQSDQVKRIPQDYINELIRILSNIKRLVLSRIQ